MMQWTGMLELDMRRTMLNRIFNIYNYLSQPGNWCNEEDRVFYADFLLFVFCSVYAMVGLYLLYPDILDLIFWPLNYYRIN